MNGDALPHPEELKRLMKARLWPRTHEEAIQQNGPRRIPVERVHKLISEEDEIFLYPDPQMTLAYDHERSRETLGGSDYFKAYDKTLEQIDPDRALFVGDFGHGSCAPIALDYRANVEDPAVIGLRWREAWRVNDDNRWIQLSPTFNEFVAKLDLWSLPKFKR